MRCEAWIGGIFAEGDITEEIRDEILTLLKGKGLKTYERPGREPDYFKEEKDRNGSIYSKLNCWFNEGIAIYSHIDNDGIWEDTRRYQIFYNKKRPKEVGFRALEYKRSKRMTQYRREGAIAEHFKNIVAFNVILGNGEEPKDFGKIPPLK